MHSPGFKNTNIDFNSKHSFFSKVRFFKTLQALESHYVSPKLNGLNSKHLLLYTKSVVQGFRSHSLRVGRSWGAVQILAGLKLSEGLPRAGGSFSFTHQANWCSLFSGGLSSLPCWPLHRSKCMGVFLTWQLPLPEWVTPREQGRSLMPFMNSDVTHRHFHHTLFVQSRSLSSIHVQGEGNETSRFEGKRFACLLFFFFFFLIHLRTISMIRQNIVWVIYTKLGLAESL